MKVLTYFNNLRLILFVLMINFCSCADDKIKEYDVTVDYAVRVSLYEGRDKLLEGEFPGTLYVEDLDGQKFEFDIKTGDNEIELPFGFYKARVKGFENCSSSDFNLLALGGNKLVRKNIYLSVIPNYNVEILSILPYSYGGYNLLFKADSPDDYYRYKLWGSNDEEKIDREIIQLHWTYRWIYDGQSSFNLDGDYKYYCVTSEPYFGYRENSECINWFEFIKD